MVTGNSVVKQFEQWRRALKSASPDARTKAAAHIIKFRDDTATARTDARILAGTAALIGAAPEQRRAARELLKSLDAMQELIEAAERVRREELKHGAQA